MDEEKRKILGAIAIQEELIEEFNKDAGDILGFQKKIQEYLDKETTSLLSLILLGAVKLDASDIHIEPEEERAKIRLRIDGILNDIVLLNNDIYHNLLSRIKLLSKLKLNISEKPQEGRFSVDIGDSLIEMRSSILPSEYGESILMRILNPKNLMELDKLGLRKDLYETIDQQLKVPNGMIVVSGPTGSGKTTTLYAFLMKIKTQEIKIITIEDPIEYHLDGISQTQVNPKEGYTFSKGLVSIMRQDPDIILIGETRDTETAKISLQASLTGHLVLTTIHTNDAAGTIPRFKDLGTELSSIAPAIKTIISQRLIRLVCKECSTSTSPSKEDLEEIKQGLKSLPKEVDIPKNLNDIKIKKASEKGCKNCNFTGYVGRKGIFEVAAISPEIEKFILTNPSTSSIKELFIKKGMVTIYQSGLIEVVLGNTTIEEIERVVGIEEKLTISREK